MRLKMFILTTYLALLSQWVQADNFYGELGGLYHSIEIDGLRFSQPAVQVRAGYYFQPQLGIEIHGAKGGGEDVKKGLTTELDYLAGVDFRFESPEVNLFKAYITLGYARTVMSMSQATSSYPGDGSFDSPNAGIGAEVATGWNRNLFIYGKYTHFFHDDGVDMGGFSVGTKYDF